MKLHVEMNRGSLHAVSSRPLSFIVASVLLVCGFYNAAVVRAMPAPADFFQTNGVAFQNFIFNGTLWHRYIDAYVYHVLDDRSVRNASLIRTLFTVALENQNPCKHMSLVANISNNDRYQRVMNITPYRLEQFATNWTSRIYHLRIKSQICGSISSNVMSQRLADRWYIRVHNKFKLNVTVTRLEVNFFLGCDELQAVLYETVGVGSFHTIGYHCPNSVPRSFYSEHNIILINVEILREYLSGLNAPRVDLAHLEFRYHVLDKNFEVILGEVRTLNSVFKEGRALVHTDDLPGKSAISFHMTMSPDGAPQMSIKSSQSNNRANHAFNFPLPVTKLIEIWAFENFQLHVVYIQAPVGKTISISSGALFCQADKGKAVFFDGPPVDIFRIESMLVRLAEWHGQVLANLSLTHFASPKSHEKVRASIGDITVVITSLSHQKVQLHMHLEFSGTDNIKYQNINISSTKTIDILPDPKMSSVHVLNLYSAHSISVIIDKLTYEGYSDESCDTGGVFMFSNFTHVGSICSQLIAKLMVNHYHKHGIRLGDSVQIAIKQYVRLSRITARFHVSTSNCTGYLNLFANDAFTEEGYSIIRGARVRQFPVYYDFPLGMDIKYKTTFWEADLAQHPSLQEYWRTLHIKREAEFCLYIQIVYLGNIPYSRSPKTMLYVSSNDRREYSRFEVRLSYFPRRESAFHCEDDVRLHLDTKKNYTKIPAQHPDNGTMFSAEAYNTKVDVPLSCLWEGFAFALQVTGVEKTMWPECFSEFGKYMYDLVQPIIPSGVCGSMHVVPHLHHEAYTWREARVSFQKPLEIPSCCFYNLVVKMRGNVDCNYYGILARPGFPYYQHDVQWEWELYNVTSPLVWQGNCFRMSPYREIFVKLSIVDTCLDLEIYTGTLDNSSCDFEVSFSAGLHTFSKTGELRQNDTTQERWLCSEDVCYVSPTRAGNVTWNDAKGICEGKGGHLASINSDEEWGFLTSHYMENNTMSTLLNFWDASIYFMGLRGNVSALHFLTNITNNPVRFWMVPTQWH